MPIDKLGSSSQNPSRYLPPRIQDGRGRERVQNNTQNIQLDEQGINAPSVSNLNQEIRAVTRSPNENPTTSSFTEIGATFSATSAIIVVATGLALVAASVFGMSILPFTFPIFIGALVALSIGLVLVGIGAYRSSSAETTAAQDGNLSGTDLTQNLQPPKKDDYKPVYNKTFMDDLINEYADLTKVKVEKSEYPWLRFANIEANSKFVPKLAKEAAKKANVTRFEVKSKGASSSAGFASSFPTSHNLGAFYQTLLDTPVTCVHAISSDDDLNLDLNKPKCCASYWDPSREALSAVEEARQAKIPEKLKGLSSEPVKIKPASALGNPYHQFVIPEDGIMMPNGKKVTVHSRLIEDQEIDRDKVHSSVYELTLTSGKKTKTLTVIHSNNWKDLSSVNNPAALGALRDLRQQYSNNNSANILTHCTAGVGRTGSIVAIDLMRDHSLTLREAIDLMRAQRHPHCPQTKPQLETLFAYAQENNIFIDSSQREIIVRQVTELEEDSVSQTSEIPGSSSQESRYPMPAPEALPAGNSRPRFAFRLQPQQPQQQPQPIYQNVNPRDPNPALPPRAARPAIPARPAINLSRIDSLRSALSRLMRQREYRDRIVVLDKDNLPNNARTERECLKQSSPEDRKVYVWPSNTKSDQFGYTYYDESGVQKTHLVTREKLNAAIIVALEITPNN